MKKFILCIILASVSCESPSMKLLGGDVEARRVDTEIFIKSKRAYLPSIRHKESLDSKVNVDKNVELEWAIPF